VKTMFANTLFRDVGLLLSKGKWDYDAGFEFVKSGIVLSSWQEMTLSLILYFVAVFGLQFLMKSRNAMKFKSFLIVHNLFLSIGSLILLILLLENIIPLVFKNGLYFGICSPDMFKNPHLELLYYFNYLFKYWELLDTILLVLQKKSLQFLHVYHHSMTLLLCWTQLYGNTSVQWVVIVINLFVHVIMYYYYARVAMGAQIWWKKYLTTFQIVQFVIDLFVVYYCVFVVWSNRGYLDNYHILKTTFGNGAHCHSRTDFATYFGPALLTTYLLLFIEFFRETYKNRPTKKLQKSE